MIWLLLLFSCNRGEPDTVVETGVEIFEMPDAWMPELTHYPRLHPHLDDPAEVRDRIEREPYATLWARVLANSDRNPTDVTAATELHAPTAYRNGDIARACAFRAFVEDDPVYRDKAVAILTGMQTDAAEINEFDDDIHLGDALVAVATTYDLLEGIGLSDGERTEIRDKLAALADSTYTYFAVTFPQPHLLGRSNHATKIVSGVGMIALVMNDHPDAYLWMSYGITQMHWLHGEMTSPWGEVDEGPFYHLYSAQTHLPFFVAYSDLAGPMPYPPICAVRDDDPCDDRFAEIYDPPMAWETTTRQHEWGVLTRFPNGRRPPIDDAFYIPYYGGLIDDPLMRWDWLNTPEDPAFSQWTVDLAMELILRFDDAAPVSGPTVNSTVTMEGPGMAVLRSGNDPDAHMMVVTAESGEMRDTGHEQEDEGSFQVFAKGVYLLIDSSYIRWDDRDQVGHTENHNLFLVDGQGAPEGTLFAPGGVDGFLANGVDSDGFVYVETGTRYRNVDLSRRVAMVDGDWFVVADRFTADSSHAYTWLLHGWGGGDDGGTAVLRGDGATWARDGVRLDAFSAHDGANGATAFTVQPHGFRWNDLHTHQRLDLSAEATDWSVLTVLLPRDEAAPAAILTELVVGNAALAWAVEDPNTSFDLEVVAFAPGGGTVLVPAHGGCAGFDLTGELMVARLDCPGTPAELFEIENGALRP